ncbi:MAG TPA: alternative ribosome rescue aminoacyl-tRNA hydrolase ArfB [Bdellovibrionota bacterium]|jgi:ribosome-associated protein|nr:alternative ribosome rescue aminoacyl-tRNA hydrolase ArfB [Bdellovibrionota bacterium]
MWSVHPRIQIPEWEFTFRAVRSSGPGGQNVNKTSTCAELRWNVRGSPSLPQDIKDRFMDRYASRLTGDGEVILQSDVYRELPRNRVECLERLRRMMLTVADPPKPRKATKPTRSSKKRRVEGKRRRSEVKRGRAGAWD